MIFLSLLPCYPALLNANAEEKALPIDVYDLSPWRAGDLNDPRRCREIWDTCHFAASLQGLANRDEPRLYLRYLPADDYWWEKFFPPETDTSPSSIGQSEIRNPRSEIRNPRSALSAWLAGREVRKIGTLEELVATFRGVFRGVVAYDERVPATSNVASTLAGVENLVCLRYDETPGSLYDRLVNGGPRLPVVRRLMKDDGTPLFTGQGSLPDSTTPSCGSAKGDAYLWAKEQYLDTGRCNPLAMGYYLDTCWLRNPGSVGHTNHTLTNHDFFIARRGFFFDLGVWDDEKPIDDPDQPLGTDAKVLAEILRSAYQQARGERFIHVGGFVPWAIKYTNYGPAGGTHEPVPSEWRYAEILSCFNAYMDADALGLGAMANASFFQHFPLEEHYPQNPRPTDESLRARGLLDEAGRVLPRRYVAFYVGDYDSAAWLYNQTPHVWDDPGRGSVPMSWAFNPNLEERIAPALVYTRLTRTANDVFIAGDSGAGYLNPGHLEEPRQFSELPSGVGAWARHCTPYYRRWDLGVTGFIIDGYAPGMSDKGLDAYAQFSPDGIVAQKVSLQTLHGDLPVLRMTSDLGDDQDRAVEIIASRFQGIAPQFLIFRSILKTPTWHRELVDQLKARHPEEPLEVVDAITLLALLQRYEREREK